ncbi:UNVERIFIED_CONTAM: hypothetical protein GTU68_053967 [Idotea baltica]|nr:hypothetical protein [Idotea baltica]
MLQSLLKAMVL